MNMPYNTIRNNILKIFFLLSDTTVERNALMADVYPRLKEYCRERHGLEFQVSLKSFCLYMYLICL